MTTNRDVPPRGKGCVPYLIVALILGALGYLVASSDVGGSSGSLPAPRSNAAAVDTQDAAYLAALAGGAPDWGGYSDAQLIAAGNLVCSDLGQGEAVSVVGLALSTASGLDLGQAGYLMGAAVGAYCPEYSSKFSS